MGQAHFRACPLSSPLQRVRKASISATIAACATRSKGNWLMSDELKRCPACAELIQAAAHKCRYCGTDLDAYAAAHETSAEQTLFSGHPRVIYTFGQYVVAVCTLGIALLVYWVRSLSLTFTVTTQRVRV